MRPLRGGHGRRRASGLRRPLPGGREPGLKKKPSTSELLDWLKLLLAEDVSPDVLASDDRRKTLPPLHGALLKNEQDVHLFERMIFLSQREGR